MVGADAWDDVGREWATRHPDRLWREFTDRLQAGLLERWLGPAPNHADGRVPTALKTDLFDEIAGRGVVPWLTTRGYHTVGIDISAVVVKEARRRYVTLESAVADVRNMPFQDACFDAVFSGSTLDHFATTTDIIHAAREIARVLRPSGRLVLTLDNPRNPLVRVRNGPLLGILRRSGVVPYEVGATLAAEPLTEVLRSVGLRAVKTSAVLHCPRVLAVWCSRLLQHANPVIQERFLAMLSSCEKLEHLRTRFLTGHFVAILAVKTPASLAEAAPSPPSRQATMTQRG